MPGLRFLSVVSARALGAVANLALVLLIAAKGDVGEAGEILFLWSSAQFLGTLSRGGSDTVLLRQYSNALELKNFGLANGLLTQCVGLSLVVGTIFSVAVWVVLCCLPDAIAGGYRSDAWLFLIATPLLAAGLSAAETLKAVGAVELAGFLQSGFLSTVACIVLLFSSSVSAFLLALAFVVGALLILVPAILLHVRRVGLISDLQFAPWAEIRHSAWRIFLVELLRIGTMWIPMLSVSWLATPQQLGWFMIATRLSMALNVVGAGINGLVGSQVAKALAQRDLNSIVANEKKLFSITSKLVPFVIAACFIFSLIAVNYVDQQYQGAGYVFAVSLAGQSFRAAFGYIGVTLSILRFEYLTLRGSILGFLVVLLLGPCLTIWMGALGAACALALGILAQSICNIVQWRRMEKKPDSIFYGLPNSYLPS